MRVAPRAHARRAFGPHAACPFAPPLLTCSASAMAHARAQQPGCTSPSMCCGPLLFIFLRLPRWRVRGLPGSTHAAARRTRARAVCVHPGPPSSCTRTATAPAARLTPSLYRPRPCSPHHPGCTLAQHRPSHCPSTAAELPRTHAQCAALQCGARPAECKLNAVCSAVQCSLAPQPSATAICCRTEVCHRRGATCPRAPPKAGRESTLRTPPRDEMQPRARVHGGTFHVDSLHGLINRPIVRPPQFHSRIPCVERIPGNGSTFTH